MSHLLGGPVEQPDPDDPGGLVDLPFPARLNAQAGGGAGDESNFKLASVYRAIVEHQHSATWWPNCGDLKKLRAWSFVLVDCLRRFIRASSNSGRNIDPDELPPARDEFPIPLVKIEKMNLKTVGAYRQDADGYAIVGTICFNETRLAGMPHCVLLAYLTKFLICAWRHYAAGSGDFDGPCRGWLKAFGIVIDGRGNVVIIAGSPFSILLGEAGIDSPAEACVPPPPREGKAQSKLWSCRCQRVRVGTRKFFARCTKCGYEFELGDHVGSDATTTARSPGTEIVPWRPDDN